MAFSKAVTSGLSCNGCRFAIVRSLTSISSVAPLVCTPPIRRQPPPLHRPFSAICSLQTENATLEQELESFSSSHPIPWYLQRREQPSTSSSGTPQHQADLPPLPPNPPPLLEPLLNHLSLTLGMDDISLLDLRHLDPPPALGSKLIMLVCTARSEKHLHVSADRLCRLVRREHNLRANAAGLLGRNELKIKLRRKAKRMKMLANLGAQQDVGANIDDGIRTGWICVTLGRIPAHKLDTYVPGAQVEDFVGFRETSTGVNVVVQMFTEEKRSEIDLETLWGGIVGTKERKDKQVDNLLGVVPERTDMDVVAVKQVDEVLALGTEHTDVDDVKDKQFDGLLGIETEDVKKDAASLKEEKQAQISKPNLTRMPSDPFPPASWEEPSPVSRKRGRSRRWNRERVE